MRAESRRRLVAAAAAAWAVAGCGPDPADCRIDRFVTLDGAGHTPTDCGQFALGDPAYTDSAMLTAQECVVAAVAAPHAFQLIYDVYDPYQHLRAAWDGEAGGKLGLRVYAYVGDSLGGSGDPRPIVTVANCSTVTATAACDPKVGKPCLQCGMESTGSALCRF